MQNIIHLNFFKCDPLSICRTAMCCRAGTKKPVASVGDFLRISAFKGMDMVDAWQKFGALSVISLPETPQGDMAASLAIRNDPACPFLLESEKFRCGVQEVKPISCADFPISQMMLGNIDPLDRFPCMDGRVLTEKHRAFARGLMELYFAENEFEYRNFLGIFRELPVPSARIFVMGFQEAIDLQNRRDPNGLDEQTHWLNSNRGKVQEIGQSGKADVGFFVEVFGRMYYTLLYGDVCDVFAMLPSNMKAMDFYRRSTDRYLEIMANSP